MQCWVDGNECKRQMSHADAGVLHVKWLCEDCSIVVSNRKEIKAIFRQVGIKLDLLDPEELIIDEEDQEFLRHMSPEILSALNFIDWPFEHSGNEEIEPEDIETLKEIFRSLAKRMPEEDDK